MYTTARRSWCQGWIFSDRRASLATGRRPLVADHSGVTSLRRAVVAVLTPLPLEQLAQQPEEPLAIGKRELLPARGGPPRSRRGGTATSNGPAMACPLPRTVPRRLSAARPVPATAAARRGL